MKNDHVAAIPLVHWPKPVSPWYLDLRRTAALLARPGAMVDPQRLLPPDGSPLRVCFAPIPTHTSRPIWLRRSSGASPRQSAGLPVTIGCDRAGGGSDRARAGASDRVFESGTSRSTAPPLKCPQSREIENLIETSRHDEAHAGLVRVEPLCPIRWRAGSWRRHAAATGHCEPGLSSHQPAQRTPARRRALARRGARSAA